MKKAKKQINRPWLNESGVIHTDAKLKQLSTHWCAETWEQFLLATVEGSSSYQREDLVSPKAYDSALDEMTESIWDSNDEPADETLCDIVKRYCRDHLTPQQQHITRLTFWNGLSEKKIGENLGISRSSVMTQKRRALSKLKHLLEKRESIFCLGERVVKPDPTRVRSRDANIREVYQQEIKNFYGKFGG